MPGGLLLLVVLAAVVFSVGFAISGLFRLYLTPGRLVVEEFLFWKSVRLDSLAGIQVIPGGTGGARIRLRDTTGGECEVSFGALSPAGLRRLISTLRGQLDEQPGVESAGGVSQVLTRYETGKWRKLD